MTGVLHIKLGWVVLKEVSPLTDKPDLVTKRDGGAKPVRDPQVSRERGGRGLEARHPVTGGQQGGRGPGLVPLTTHRLAGGVAPVRLKELPGRPAVIPETRFKESLQNIIIYSVNLRKICHVV